MKFVKAMIFAAALGVAAVSTGSAGQKAPVTDEVYAGVRESLTVKRANDADSRTVYLVGMSGTTSGDTFAQATTGKWSTEWFDASVLSKNGAVDRTKKEHIRQQQNYTLTITPKSGFSITSVFMVADSENEGDFSLLNLTNATGAKEGSNYRLTPNTPSDSISATLSSGKMLRYNLEITIELPAPVGDIVSLAVQKAPADTDFYVGEAFSVDGLEVWGYDSEGNHKVIDASLLTFEPAAGYVFTEEDITSEGTEVHGTYSEGDTTIEFGLGTETRAWTYTVSEMPETLNYQLNAIDDLKIGQKVVLGLDGTGGDVFANGLANRLTIGTEELGQGEDGVITIDPMGAIQPIVFEVRIGLGEGSFSLYSKDFGGYLLTENGETALSFDETLTYMGSFELASRGDGYRITCVSNSSRYLGRNGNYIGAYAANGSYDSASLYSLPVASEDAAGELARYIMESDIEGQCVDKFPIAKDAYINLMDDAGRAAFETMTEAYERYIAWAVALGQNPFDDEPAQASAPFIGDSNSAAWMVTGILSFAALASGLGLVVYKKRKEVK